MSVKTWSKKKKIIVGVVSALVLLILLAFGGALYALNWYCQPIEAKPVVSVSSSKNGSVDSRLKLVAHRGLSSQAPENTLPAYTLAGQYGYWGAECDIYRTKDGKWVLMHDNYLYRLMDGSGAKKVESMTYEDLLEYNYTNGANINMYSNLKVTLFEDYLDECKKYNMVPVIEYKSDKNFEYLNEVIEILRAKDLEKKAVIISFNIDALREFKKYTQIIPLWYLVQKVDEKTIEEAKSLDTNAGIDFNANNEKTTRAMVQKASDEGLTLACWTVDDTNVMDTMLEWGVKIITTNTIVPAAKK